jgi:ssDNA thymidine ADP-ribosyltransferase, DarT
VRRHELEELHYITAIGNVPSILQHGILSHSRAAKLPHESVAMAEIQDRRAKVVVPGGRRLHDYANLYVCARNPMLYKRSAQHLDICVLRIDPGVLDLPGVVVTDGNASSDYVRFTAGSAGLAIVDRERTFAEWWTDPDPFEYFRKKSAKCAEVLVPDRVPAHLVTGAYVSCGEALARFAALGMDVPTEINQHLFFR